VGILVDTVDIVDNGYSIEYPLPDLTFFFILPRPSSAFPRENLWNGGFQ
jgi:hypothetical protein